MKITEIPALDADGQEITVEIHANIADGINISLNWEAQDEPEYIVVHDFQNWAVTLRQAAYNQWISNNIFGEMYDADGEDEFSVTVLIHVSRAELPDGQPAVRLAHEFREGPLLTFGVGAARRLTDLFTKMGKVTSGFGSDPETKRLEEASRATYIALQEHQEKTFQRLVERHLADHLTITLL